MRRQEGEGKGKTKRREKEGSDTIYLQRIDNKKKKKRGREPRVLFFQLRQRKKKLAGRSA